MAAMVAFPEGAGSQVVTATRVTASSGSGSTSQSQMEKFRQRYMRAIEEASDIQARLDIKMEEAEDAEGTDAHLLLRGECYSIELELKRATDKIQRHRRRLEPTPPYTQQPEHKSDPTHDHPDQTQSPPASGGPDGKAAAGSGSLVQVEVEEQRSPFESKESVIQDRQEDDSFLSVAEAEADANQDQIAPAPQPEPSLEDAAEVQELQWQTAEVYTLLFIAQEDGKVLLQDHGRLQDITYPTVAVEMTAGKGQGCTTYFPTADGKDTVQSWLQSRGMPSGGRYELKHLTDVQSAVDGVIEYRPMLQVRISSETPDEFSWSSVEIAPQTSGNLFWLGPDDGSHLHRYSGDLFREVRVQ